MLSTDAKLKIIKLISHGKTTFETAKLIKRSSNCEETRQ